MNCQSWRLQISDHLGGALDPDREAGLLAHLETCPACARFADQQAELDALLGADSLELEPPRRMWNQIQARLSRPPETFREAAARWTRDLLGVPSLRQALAGMAVMLFVSLALINQPRQRDSDFLAELESYQMDVGGHNPFLREDTSWNPFFPMRVARDQNLFEESRNQR